MVYERAGFARQESSRFTFLSRGGLVFHAETPFGGGIRQQEPDVAEKIRPQFFFEDFPDHSLSQMVLFAFKGIGNNVADEAIVRFFQLEFRIDQMKAIGKDFRQSSFG